MSSNSAVKNRRLTDLHVLSHEVRTPLNGILGLLTMLEEHELPDATRSLLNRIELCAEGLNQHLNNAIEVQRIASNKVVFTHRDYSLLQVAESSIRLYSAEAESKGVDLMLQFDPRLIGKNFIGDQERLLQILSALVSNAVKFTDNGSVTLVVGLRKEKATTSQVIFRVIDSGIGIPEEEIPLVVQSHYQIASATKGRPPGSGAGLYIAHNLLKLMSSSLEIRSNPAGTQVNFTLDLPASNARATNWQQKQSHSRIQFIAPASAQTELNIATLGHFGMDVTTSDSLTVAEVSAEADLRIIDYRLAAKNLVLFRHLTDTARPNTICLLSTEFEPATAMLAKNCRQLNTPYLPSDLVSIAESADLLEPVAVETASDQTKPATLPEDLSSFCILCVDDSPTNLIVLVGALAKMGFKRVLRAVDGQDAVEVMRAHPEVDLILMDFHMPRLNGAQAARQIRDEGCTAPILGVTALSETDLSNQLSVGDFDLLITKPIRTPILSEALTRCLVQHPERREM